MTFIESNIALNLCLFEFDTDLSEQLDDPSQDIQELMIKSFEQEKGTSLLRWPVRSI